MDQSASSGCGGGCYARIIILEIEFLVSVPRAGTRFGAGPFGDLPKQASGVDPSTS